MDDQLALLFVIMEAGGVLAPIAFIFLHFFRQFLFIPVTIICLAGGILFGTVFGTLFSIIGLMLSSMLFYFMIHKMPKTKKNLSLIKTKWFGEYRNLTVGQITVLRLVPFIHYHLLSFCLLERKSSFKDYMKSSCISNLPLAFIYTVFGEFISRFTPTIIAVILCSLMILVYLLREKVAIIKWREFFKVAA